MVFRGKNILKLLFLLAFMSSKAYASGDQLKPDEIQTEGVSSTPANESGLFVGARGYFGQGRSTGGGGPGVGSFLSVEPGYQVKNDSWNRLEFGGSLFMGQASYRESEATLGGGKATAKVDFGLLVNGAWGYSLGGSAFGLLKAGVGPFSGSYALKSDDFGTYNSEDLSGLAWQLGYDVVVPGKGAVDFIGGVNLLQLQIDPGYLREGSNRYKFSRTLHVNIPSANFGIRFRI